MFDLTTYVKKWRIRQLKTVFSTLDTLCAPSTGFATLARSTPYAAMLQYHLEPVCLPGVGTQGLPCH